MSNTLEKIDRESILRNTHWAVKNKYRRHELWVFVRDVCGVGSHSAVMICRELGWNPEAAATAPLPRGNQS